jgi:hypothetical protein
MNNKKAIEILQKQIHKLDDARVHKDENWVYQTASYIKDFFGESSTEYTFICNFSFKVLASNYDDPKVINYELASKPKKAKKYLENCIETISNKGLYKQPKTNFLNRISDTALWTIISISFTGLIYVGFFFGNLYSDKQNIEIKTENEKLKDSLSVFKQQMNKISNQNSNKISNKKSNYNSIHNLNNKTESDLKGAETKPKN